MSFITVSHCALIKSNKLIFARNSASGFTGPFIAIAHATVMNPRLLQRQAGMFEWCQHRINISQLQSKTGCNITELVCRQSNQVRRIWFYGAHGGLEYLCMSRYKETLLASRDIYILGIRSNITLLSHTQLQGILNTNCGMRTVLRRIWSALPFRNLQVINCLGVCSEPTEWSLCTIDDVFHILDWIYRHLKI